MSEETNNNVEQELDLNQLMIIRREKLEKLKQENKNPFEITKRNALPTLAATIIVMVTLL